MSHSAINRAPLLCLAAAILAGALGPLRAQSPPNPLRLAPIVSPHEVGLPTPADPRTRPRANEFTAVPTNWIEPNSTDQPAAPQSIVPNHFGPPEALPPGGESFAPYPHDYFSDQLVHRIFVHPWFSHSDPNDPYRHIGVGQPLIGTSWRNRPWFAGAFYGGIITEDLTTGVDQSDTAFGGFRIGIDFDHYWGVEFRYAFAAPELTDGDGGAIGNGHSRANIIDVSLAYYPWGDARWRPYFLVGLGFQTFRFYNAQDERVSESLASIPLGIGLKYYCAPWFILRFDVTDNIALGNDHLDGMHNLSLMLGAECRFGGPHQSYFPWHGNTTYW
jgi:hypothetical protein